MEITPYEINLIEVVQKVIFFEHALIDKTKKLPPLHAKDESLTSAVPPLLMIHHPTRCPVTGALSGFAAGRSGIGFEEARVANSYSQGICSLGAAFISYWSRHHVLLLGYHAIPGFAKEKDEEEQNNPSSPIRFTLHFGTVPGHACLPLSACTLARLEEGQYDEGN
ncbi:hypothetical protein QYF50_14660 [Paenibacillus vini]|uniref:hypothetical protein n=1 Tax=Paenibacillus vini TaxID=1476024 RepID=UPI0025B653EA|nr:hypothetical protein [Paenibacillus vini]MDN4069142.1 hypothetical protein [Paenibacillus vini]